VSTILEAVLHHREIASLLRLRRLGDLRSENLLRKSVDDFRRSTTSDASPGTFLTPTEIGLKKSLRRLLLPTSQVLRNHISLWDRVIVCLDRIAS
jgi:hypothetical protein